MDNPYQSPPDSPAEGTWQDVLARTTAVVLHLLLWVAFIMLAGPILRQYVGEPLSATGRAGAQLTTLQSFNRFVIMYGFLAVMLCFVLDIGVWIALRRSRRRIRWRWLAITSALIPVSTIVTWLVLHPVLFA